MQNFYTSPDGFTTQAVTLTGDEYRHATRACRVKVGEEISITDGLGRRVIARIGSIDSERLRAQIIQDVSSAGEPVCAVTLALATIKAARFEMAVEKCTELGVRAIVPVITDRCEQHAEHHLHIDRISRIAQASAKQAARSIVPVIGESCELAAFIHKHQGVMLVASQHAHESLESVLGTMVGCEAITCLIGPEGDFTDNEYKTIETAGAIPVSLGELTLRSETAAIVAVARVLSGMASKQPVVGK
jgi:16S rRNA (uracil1498-N3)-methyltransferase